MTSDEGLIWGRGKGGKFMESEEGSVSVFGSRPGIRSSEIFLSFRGSCKSLAPSTLAQVVQQYQRVLGERSSTRICMSQVTKLSQIGMNSANRFFVQSPKLSSTGLLLSLILVPIVCAPSPRRPPEGSMAQSALGPNRPRVASKHFSSPDF